MTIKTLHITNSYHPTSGGIRTFYHALLSGANRHARPVRLVVPGERTCVEEVGAFGRIYHVAAPRVPIVDSRYRWMLPHTYAWPYSSVLRGILAAERPDVVEVCDKFWLLYLSGVLRRGWIRGLPPPVIVGLTCERLDGNMATYIGQGRLLAFAHERYMRSCYAPRFDFHLAASGYIAEEVQRVLPARLKDRLFVAPMGVDFDSFSRPPVSTGLRQSLLCQLDGSENTRLLLYAGRLSKEKNLLLLPPMMAELARRSSTDYRLVLAGDGPLAAALREAFEQVAPKRALFLGHFRAEDLPELYHSVDTFIHPNPREPFGIAPLEAMSAGLPLVAPASGGVLTYANPENAWLAADTPASFATQVMSALADSAERCLRIERARRTARQFAWPLIIQNYFRLYDGFHHLMRHAALTNVSAPPELVAESSAPHIRELV